MAGRNAIFHVCVAFEGRIEFGRDEGEEKVEKVDAEGVGDYLAAVSESARTH